MSHPENKQDKIKQKKVDDQLFKIMLEQSLKKEPVELEEDKIYKSQLLAKISRYREVFSEYLMDISYKNIETMKISELELILQSKKNNVSNRNMQSNSKGMIFMAPKLIENAGSYLGLQLEGYSNVVNSQKDYYYTCQELLIEQTSMTT